MRSATTVCRPRMAEGDVWPPLTLIAVQSFQIGEELEDMDLDMEEMDGDDSDEESESRPSKKARK